MQLLDHLGDIRAEEARVGPEQLKTARAALLREIARTRGNPGRARHRRRFGTGFGRGGSGAIAAGALAVVAIVTGAIVAPAPGTMPAASAAEVLKRASASVLTSVSAADAPLAAGQYLRIVATRTAITSDGTGPDAVPESAAFATRNVTTLYVPADRDEDWIRETESEEITGVYGPDGEAFLRRVKAEPSTAETGVVAIPAGVETFGDTTQPIDPYRDSYDDMPRDPAALLDWFQAQTPSGYEGLAILNALDQNLPPANLRAAMLGALARIDGIALVTKEGSLATIQQTRGDRTQQFVVDTESGLIVSVIEPQRYPNDIVPDGTPDARVTLTMSIVDSAPLPTS